MVAYEYVIVVSMYDVLVLTAQVGEPVIHSAWALGDADEMEASGRSGRGDLSDRRGGQWLAGWSVCRRDERFTGNSTDHGRQVIYIIYLLLLLLLLLDPQ